MSDLYEGPDRRKTDLHSMFEAAVRTAAADAAQQVAQIHRRRLVVQSFLAAFVLSSLLAVSVGKIVYDGERSFAHANAVYDCRLFRHAAGIVSDFVTSDANLRDRQNREALGPELTRDFQKIIKHSTLLRLALAQKRDVAQVVLRWRRDGVMLQQLGATDCQAHLGG